ncbi:MAG: hypothetical protein JST98_06110 [Bacteroidetes bacterium]|nr:hypothetical protein [Bacteroidota bacterium]
MNNARKALKQFVQGMQRPPLLTGKVIAVEADTCDVDPSDGGPTIYMVRLKPAIGTAQVGAITYPKVGSPCVIAELDGDANKYILVNCEQVDRLLVKLQGGATVEVKNDGTLELNGAQYGGLVKVQQLRQELAKVNAILQAVQQAFSSWMPANGDSGVAALKAASNAFTALQRPDYNTIESQKTKHGSA